MTDSLTIFGSDYTGVTGIKATGTGNGTLTYIRPQGTYSVTSSGTKDVTNYASASVPEASQFVSLDSGYFHTDDGIRYYSIRPFAEIDVSEGDTPGWVGAGKAYGEYANFRAIEANTTITPSTSAQTIGDDHYVLEDSITVAAMPSGSVSASATKGSVSNHSVNVTPTATVGTAGYLAAGSTNGTAVSVSASELVSGSQTITENDTYDVTNLAEVVVAVSGGSTGLQIDSVDTEISSASSSITFTGLQAEPTSFVIYPDSGKSTRSPANVVAVVFDGTTIHGQTASTTSNANAHYDTGFTKSYSNGTLTVTATTAQFLDDYWTLDYTYGGGSIETANVQVGSGATSITFTDLDDEPEYFTVIFKSDFGTSSGYQRVMWLRKSSSNTYGACMDSSVHLTTSYWTSSYSSGSLTITSQGTNQGGYFHQPGYYQLTYAVAGGGGNYQSKTVTPTTSQQVVQADSGYDALKKVTVEAMPSMTLPTAASGTSSGTSKATITPTSSAQYLNIPTGYNSSAAYYTIAAASGGSVTVKTTTMTNNSATATQIQFTSLTGQPKAFFCRCTSNLSRNSSNRYYYIADIRWDGSSTGGVAGNKYYVYNGQYSNQTTGYSQSYSDGTLTLTTTGSQTASPGSFYNGTYELVYVY